MVTISQLATILTRLSSSLGRVASPYYQLRRRILRVAILHRMQGLSGQPLKVPQYQQVTPRLTSLQTPAAEIAAVEVPAGIETPPGELAAPPFSGQDPLFPALVLQESLARRLEKVHARPIWRARIERSEGFLRPHASLGGQVREFEGRKRAAEILRGQQVPAVSEFSSGKVDSFPATWASGPGQTNKSPSSHEIISMVSPLAGFIPLFPALPSLIFPVSTGTNEPGPTGKAVPFRPAMLSLRSTVSAEPLPKAEQNPVGLSIERLQQGRSLAMRQVGLPTTSPVVETRASLLSRADTRPSSSLQIRPGQSVETGLVSHAQHEQSESRIPRFAPARNPNEPMEPTAHLPEQRTQRTQMMLNLAKFYSYVSIPLIGALTKPSERSPYLLASQAKTPLQFRPGIPDTPASTQMTSRNLNQLVTTYAEAESLQTRLQLLGNPAPTRRAPQVELPLLQVSTPTRHSSRETPGGAVLGRTISVLQSPTLDLPKVELPEISNEDQLPSISDQGPNVQDTDGLRQRVAKMLAEEARRYLGDE